MRPIRGSGCKRNMDVKKIVSEMTLEEKARLCFDESTYQTVPYEKYGIPKLVMTDGTSGVCYHEDNPSFKGEDIVFLDVLKAETDVEIINGRPKAAEEMEHVSEQTCFPAGSGLACSWDVDLAEEIAAACAEECKGLGIGMLFGPGMNIRRAPLDARGFEYYSEDPCLSGEMAGHYVIGLQKNDVAGCIKHFACNNSNYMRSKSNSVVDERALREIYLAGFERAINVGKPAALMTSYNQINGEQTVESKWLLTDILRNEWGFDGMVISDYCSVKDNLKAFEAGLDWEMPLSISGANILVKAVQDGRLDEAVIDKHCENILKVVDRYSRQGKEIPEVDFKAHHKLVEKAALECGVLLKNEDNILPVDTKRFHKIAVLGDAAVHPVFQGTGCASVNAKYVDIPLDEIKKLCSDDVTVNYAAGYTDNTTVDTALLKEAADVAKEADLAIVFVSATVPFETDDFNRRDMKIEKSHEALLEAVSRLQKNTVVVLTNCEAVEMPWADSVKAVLDMWFTGQGYGKAAAELLFGLASPSGKLPVTLPLRYGDVPCYLNYPGENYENVYEEGLFVGYRYYEKRKMTTRYPFGHGLSYTSFAYSDISVSAKECELGSPLTVSVKVTNSGKMAGAEVVQCYISDGHSRLKRPIKELKHFAKIMLEPGECRTVTFELNERDFAYYDPKYKKGGWIVDQGVFTILIGSSSADIRQSAEVIINNSKQKYVPFIEPDSHFLDVMKNEHAKEVLYQYLLENHLMEEKDLTPENDELLEGNFWGMAQHFDFASPKITTPERMQELADKMNG